MALNKVYTYIIITNILVTATFTLPKMNKKQCLAKDNMITPIIKISLDKCLQECVMRIACLSLNYRRLHLLCELFSVYNGTFVTTNGKTGPCVHILRSDIAEPKYPVDCACTSQQTCLPDNGTCVNKECTNVEFPNVVQHGNMNEAGALVSVKCVSELCKEETGRTSIQCQPNGTWDYEPNCTSRYIGCYNDDSSRSLLSENFVANNQMTNEFCINNCLQYNFAATLVIKTRGNWYKASSECFCGNNLNENLKQPEGHCVKHCAGNTSQTCGGHWHGSVYKVK